MTRPTVRRIGGFVLAVADPDRSARFYREGLGFADEGRNGEAAHVSLGGVRLALTRAGPGAAPPPASADAPDFQHFAIRVRDMAAAFRQVSALDSTPITRGGPQRLPPADGSVTAWKFRDPDGHPLELLQLSETAGASRPLFAAIDHTALACADVQASLAFYGELGFSQGPSSHNRGDPQDRLDGLAGVDLHIATVHTAADGPHIELLHYAAPTPPPAPPPHALPFVLTCLRGEGGGRFDDPDGHRFELE